MHRARIFIWRILTPIFPHLRDTLIFLHLIHHETGRQNFHLGWLTAGRTVEGLLAHLRTHDFDQHFLAWVDEDEVVGVRKLCPPEFQYHLRVYKDGEIRGHFEVTPEAHALDHFLDRGFEPRHEDFLYFLGDWICGDSSKGDTSKIN
ncbi:MAG: hypothetical protein HW383_769 [Candidatus Magasanikbacteria bacterium]|nr:hypothetical protein [Candidatus Magasanikbacteria bacterium]